MCVVTSSNVHITYISLAFWRVVLRNFQTIFLQLTADRACWEVYFSNRRSNILRWVVFLAQSFVWTLRSEQMFIFLRSGLQNGWQIDPFFLVYISIIHIYGAYLLNVWSNARLLYACIGSYFQINKSYWKQICVIVWSILRELPSLLGSKTQIKDWWHDVTATVLCCSKILSFHVFICCSGSDRF